MTESSDACRSLVAEGPPAPGLTPLFQGSLLHLGPALALMDGYTEHSNIVPG